MYVYIIKQGEFYKIGKTRNLEARRAALQCATPTKIELIAYVETDELCLLEKKLHKELFAYHSSGEWFNFGADVLEQLVENHRFKAYEKNRRSKADARLIDSLEVENLQLKSRDFRNKELTREVLELKTRLANSESKANRIFDLHTKEKTMLDTALDLLNRSRKCNYEQQERHNKYKKNVNVSLFLLLGCFSVFLLDPNLHKTNVFPIAMLPLGFAACIFGFKFLKSELDESREVVSNIRK